MTPAEARGIIAARILQNAAENADWADYPEIGEGDWSDIVDELVRMAPAPDSEKYDAAYALLAERAES